jgi:hypothetical protein
MGFDPPLFYARLFMYPPVSLTPVRTSSSGSYGGSGRGNSHPAGW